MTTTSQPQTTTLDIPMRPTPPHWAPDPGLRGQLRWWDGTRWTSHVMDVVTASRPHLPSWFRPATNVLYAVSGLVALAFLSVALVAQRTGALTDLLLSVTQMVVIGETALLLGVGAWVYVLSGSRRVDHTRLHRDRTWLLVAWFLPVVNVIFTHQLFGETWAGIKSSTSRSSSGFSAERLPGVIHAWAWVFAASQAWTLLILGSQEPWVLVGMCALSALATLLLAGVVWVLARREAVTRVVSE